MVWRLSHITRSPRPFVRIDELALRRVLDQVAQEGARLGDRPADDRAGMRSEVERFAAGHRVGAHQHLAHRLEALALLVGDLEKADLLARIDLAVLADEALALRLDLSVERVPGGAHVGELGVAALRRHLARVQQRVLGRDRLERAVGMPEAVAEGKQPAAVVARHRLWCWSRFETSAKVVRQTVFVWRAARFERSARSRRGCG